MGGQRVTKARGQARDDFSGSAGLEHTQTELPASGTAPTEQPLRTRTTQRGPVTPSLPDVDVAEPAPLPTDAPERYEELGEHARGGLGRIVRARDTRLGRTVAIKELHKTSELAERLFVREALITARLQHPGIVSVHEAGRWPSGEPYYVMKMVSGRTLKELIDECAALTDRLALLPNVLAVAEAVAYAHSQAVIHRDLKPANVVVGDYGETVVVDWGLARALGPTSDVEHDDGTVSDAVTGHTPPQYSVSGKVIGTPAYMSPEQARGQSVDPRCDVYALGSILYELLTGLPPYPGRDGASVIEQVLAGPPAPVAAGAPDAPPDLIALADKAMARDPDQRYPSARELADDLKRFQTGQLVSAHRYSTATLVGRWLRRHAGEVAVAAVGLVALAVVGAMSVAKVIDERNDAREAQRYAEVQGQELLLQQAESSLLADPTATLAWLDRAELTAASFPRARGIARDALAYGVAAHVLGHKGWAMAAAFSPDGKTLATGSDDGTVRLWDTSTWRVRDTHVHTDGAGLLTFSPDGTRIAIGGWFGSLGVWDLATGETRASPALFGMLAEVAFSPDGRWIYATSRMGASARWDLSAADTRPVRLAGEVATVHSELDRLARAPGNDGAVILEPAAPVSQTPGRRAQVEGAVHRLTFSRDGERVFALTRKKALWAIDWNTGAARKLLAALPQVWDVVSSPSGDWLAVAAEDAKVLLVDVRAGTVKRMRGPTQAGYTVAFSPDGRTLIGAGDEGIAWTWNLDTGDQRTLRGHVDDVWDTVVSPDGRWMATASFDGDVRVWPMGAGVGRPMSAGEVQKQVIGAGGHRVATLSTTGAVRVWDVDTGIYEQLGQVSPDKGQFMSVSADGRRVVVARQNLVAWWDVATGAGETVQVDVSAPVALSPDGSWLAIPLPHGTVRMWAPGSGETFDLAVGDGAAVAVGHAARSVAFSPDGARLAVAYADGVRLWGLAERRVIDVEPNVTTGGLRVSLQFSPDGRRLAVVSAGTAFLWRIGDDAVRLSKNDHYFSGVSFSPDGRWMAAPRTDRTVSLWSVDSGEERSLVGHVDAVFKATFSGDSRYLISVSHDHTVRVWDMEDGSSRVLRGHQGSIHDLAVLSGQAEVVTASEDATLRRWEVGAERIADARTLGRLIRASTSAVIGDDGALGTPPSGAALHTPYWCSRAEQ